MSSFEIKGPFEASGSNFGDYGTVVNNGAGAGARPLEAAAALLDQVRASGAVLRDRSRGEAAAAGIAAELRRPEPDLGRVRSLLDAVVDAAPGIPPVHAAADRLRSVLRPGT